MVGRGNCISLIGMAACGKTCVGHELANLLGQAHVDTDYLIESAYGVPLQTVTDALDRDTFLDTEASIIASLNLKKTVISTGGSVCYRDKSMRSLYALGIIIFIEPTIDVIMQRISLHPDRGLIIAPGQSIADLYLERIGLYKKYADWSLNNDNLSIEETASQIAKWIETNHPDLCIPAKRV